MRSHRALARRHRQDLPDARLLWDARIKNFPSIKRRPKEVIAVIRRDLRSKIDCAGTFGVADANHYRSQIRIAGAAPVGCDTSRTPGLPTRSRNMAQLQVTRKRLGVPTDLAACHIAEEAEYVIEGYVPASAIRRL